MTKDEALRLALDALYGFIPYLPLEHEKPQCDRYDQAITAIKAALVNEALERKAENARELGLDYEPDAPKESVRLQCTTCGTVYAEGVPPQVQQPAALEAKDEPVAWAWRAFDPDEGHDGKWGSWHISDYKPPRQQSRWLQVVPLPSTTPPQRTWVGLTPEDTFEIGERLGLSDIAWVDLMQAIEDKLKQKNT